MLYTSEIVVTSYCINHLEVAQNFCIKLSSQSAKSILNCQARISELQNQHKIGVFPRLKKPKSVDCLGFCKVIVLSSMKQQ